jgi:hypothetical protein
MPMLNRDYWLLMQSRSDVICRALAPKQYCMHKMNHPQKKRIYPRTGKFRLPNTYNSRPVRVKAWVDNDGFHAIGELPPIDSGELYHEIGYWPKHIAWSDSGKTFDELLANLAKARDISLRRLRTAVLGHYSDMGISELRGFLAAERQTIRAKGDLAALWGKWPQLHEEEEIPRVPSPRFGKVYLYDGIKMALSAKGWWADLYSDWDDVCRPFNYKGDGCCPHDIFERTFGFHADTFIDLFGCDSPQPLSYFVNDVDLYHLLEKDDPRWKPILDSEWVLTGAGKISLPAYVEYWDNFLKKPGAMIHSDNNYLPI